MGQVKKLNFNFMKHTTNPMQRLARSISDSDLMLKICSQTEDTMDAIYKTSTPVIKKIKLLFFKKGKMMRTFHYITKLFDRGDYIEIKNVINVLHKTLPPFHRPRHHKHIMLIDYCHILLQLRGLSSIEQRLPLAKEYLETLDITHELGKNIEAHICSLF